MFDKILIANRGEIAVRIIRACRDLGIKTVAVYSEADKDSHHVQIADEAICIGGAPSPESYLRLDRIIAAAEVADVDAIHPGYGFLSEKENFAEVCQRCKIKFIGPKKDAIARMGDKNEARQTAKKAGVPITPGSDGTVATEAEALRIAQRIGYPVMIKAVAGGGGRGMRPAHNDASLVQGYHAARSEAEKAFGSSEIYIEKLIENPHHVEIQVIADTRGKVLTLGERDCSIQRRNQKLIEECPSPLIDEKTRTAMCRAAVKLCQAVRYENAGTLEFLVDDDGNFYFMEMNTRIQVEHPVTEEVWGIDLVRQQILVAAGEPLPDQADAFTPRGHAIEVRVNAEDPFNDFRPSPGRISGLYLPGGPGIRIDSHIHAGYTIPPYYDSLVAKIIAHGDNRGHAISRLARALDEFRIEGIKTTVPIASLILKDPDFRRGRYSTAFLEKLLAKTKSVLNAAGET